jgi:hypothetical protein
MLPRKPTPHSAFLEETLNTAPKDYKKTAYISLVRSTMEYGAIVWDPYTTVDNMNKLERSKGEQRDLSPGTTNQEKKAP